MPRRLLPHARIALRLAVLAACAAACDRAIAQQPAPAVAAQPLPNAPTPALRQRTPEEKEAARTANLAIVNGRPYQRPTHAQQFRDYLRDSYGPPAFARSTVRSLYAEATDKPDGWGQDFPGYAQRFGSAVAVTAINGNVRYGMEELFHEDLRYIPCHGCSVRRKIVNALLAEVTARHDTDGHRFFTLTPAIADFSGPIVANSKWIPGHGPIDGVIGTRTVAATRVGAHLFTEFVLERRHHDRKIEDTEPLRVPPKPAPPANP